MQSRLSKTKKTIQDEYATINANPIIKGLVQALVMVVDLFVMFLLIWHLFTYFIPQGSWLNIVDGDSMEPTLSSKQIIFTENNNIERGDIVTSYVPEEVKKQYRQTQVVFHIKTLKAVELIKANAVTK